MNSSHVRHVRAFGALSGAAAVLGGLIPEAKAAPPASNAVSSCPVTLEPADASAPWRAAAKRAETRVSYAGSASDCAAIAIEVAGDRGRVLFTTRDGRQTERPVDSPDEVGPVVAALLVTVPDGLRQDQPGGPVGGDPGGDAANAPPPLPTPARIALRAEGGGRVSAPGGFASPSFGAGIGVLAGGWEFAAFGLWDPAYDFLGDRAPDEFTMSRYEVGVSAGRRVVTNAAAFALGVNTGVAVTSESGGDRERRSTEDADGTTTAEPLLGAYVALVYPLRSAVRSRFEVSTEAVASRLGRTRTVDPELPPLPWWSGAASVGLEWELP